MSLMKKIYTALVAALFATASFAQPLAKVQANGPFANSSLRYQPNIKKPAGQPMNFIMPTVSNQTTLSARVESAASYYTTQLNSLLEKGGPGGAVEFVLREMNKVDEIKARESV